MPTFLHSKINSQGIAAYLFHLGLFAGLSTLGLGLISCNTGGGGSSDNNVTPTVATITRMTTISAASSTQAQGVIASSSVQALSIDGTNFGSGVTGVTVTIAIPGGGTVSNTLISVTPSKIMANVTINSVPSARYLTVTVKPASANAASAILGVASAYKTIADVQTILDSTQYQCKTCHVGAVGSQGGLDLRTSGVSATTLINANRTTCTSTAQYRVKPGDPRRANNVLIDVIQAKNSMADVFCHMPRGVLSAVSTTEIDAIIDWIALGAI